MAKVLGCSTHAVWRILRKEGICLQRQRSWCVSTDKEFVPKAADIVGLYLNPPQNALVICVDEKPSIQALERATGYVQTDSGSLVHGFRSTYRRHGTLNLFAALHVATGQIQTRTTSLKRGVEFQQFMDEVVAESAPDQDLHVILDNYSTHKKNQDWLERHPNVPFHFTPTSASWLNQVEIWFPSSHERRSAAPVSKTTTNSEKPSKTLLLPTTQVPNPSAGGSARSKVHS